MASSQTTVPVSEDWGALFLHSFGLRQPRITSSQEGKEGRVIGAVGSNATKAGLTELRPDQVQGSQVFQTSPAFPREPPISSLRNSLEQGLLEYHQLKKKKHTLTFQKWAEKFKV